MSIVIAQYICAPLPQIKLKALPDNHCVNFVRIVVLQVECIWMMRLSKMVRCTHRQWQVVT